MTPPPAAKPFFLPMIGLVLLFAVCGPAIGGAVFIPLAFLLEAPVAADAALHLTWIATLIGHALVLVPAYLIGFGPAAATGFFHALWDAWAPPRAPRALVAAAIGAALTYWLFLRLAQLGATIESWVAAGGGPAAGTWIDETFSGEFDASLRGALVASGAIAGLACASLASLIGLSTAPSPAESRPA